MSFFPIIIFDDAAPVGMSHGTTVATGDGEVEQNNAGTSHGSTLALAFWGGLSAGATVASGSLFEASEANVLGAGASHGSTVSSGAPCLGLTNNAGASHGSTLAQAGATFDPAAEYGLTIFLTITDSVVAAAASGRVRRHSARLKIDGVEVPISAFTLSSPRGSLGSQLSITLARPLTSQLSTASVYTFEIGIYASGWHWQTMLDSGKLSGRDLTISFSPGAPVGSPNDSLTFSTIDRLGDRWQLAPRNPVVLYDPTSLDLDTSTDAAHAIRLESGDPVLTTFEAAVGLTLYQVLARAYVAGCGFDEVQTNIADFPVKRADFSLEGGWHDGAAPLLAPFDPLYFVEGETLWIIELGAPLPAGFSAQTLTTDHYKNLGDTVPASAHTNALLLIYQETGGDYYTTRFDQETIESGDFGDPGYSRTEITRKVREYRNTAQPLTITREIVEETKTVVVNQALEIVHRETQADAFDGLGRKTSHTRSVESLVPTLIGDALALQTVSSEQCSVAYRPHPFRPSESVQDAVVTYERGLVVIDDDDQYLGEPFMLPIRDAHRSGTIKPGANQSIESRAIKTTVETLRVRGDGQVEVYSLVLDHLANTSERSEAQPRVGAVSFNPSGSNTKQMLLTVPGTEATGRRVAVFNAGALPRELALALGRRRLARLNNPPHALRFAPVGVDLTLRRGSVRKMHDRNGAALGVFMIESTTITGAHVGGNNFDLSMSGEGSEVAPS